MRLTVAEKTKRLRKIISSLEKRYGRGNFPERNSFVEQLVFYYIFYHANLSGARKALKSFRDNYVDWNEVRVSSLGEIGATLQNHSITPEAAVPIKEVLNGIFSTQNRMSLDFLADEEPEEVVKFFQGVPGARWDCARFLISTLASDKEFPVTEHAKRVLGRFGLAGPAAKDHETRSLVTGLIQPRDYMRLFFALIEHGKRTCLAVEPLCEKCDLQPLCAYRREELKRLAHGKGKKTAGKAGKKKAAAKKKKKIKAQKKRRKPVDRKTLLRKKRRERARQRRKSAKASKARH